jgi:hypothetical protein
MIRVQMIVPLAQRSACELQAKAAELLSMAETARTADTRDALRRLAGRFARLAESRGASAAGGGSWFCMRSADPSANPNL